MTCHLNDCECGSSTHANRIKYYDVVDNEKGKTIQLCNKAQKKLKVTDVCCVCKRKMMQPCLKITPEKRVINMCILCCDDNNPFSFEKYFLDKIRQNDCILYELFPNYSNHLPKEPAFEKEECQKCHKMHPKNILKIEKHFKIYALNCVIPLVATFKVMSYISKRIEAKKATEPALVKFMTKFIKEKKAYAKSTRLVMKPAASSSQPKKRDKPSSEKPKKQEKPAKKPNIGKEKPDIAMDFRPKVVNHFIPKASMEQSKKISKKLPHLTQKEAATMISDNAVEGFVRWLRKDATKTRQVTTKKAEQIIRAQYDL